VNHFSGENAEYRADQDQLRRSAPAILLIALAAVCWAITAQRMRGMDMGPGTDLGGLGWFTIVWTTMMAAMMLPSFTPTVAVFATLTRRREPSRWLLFACGYLLAWTVAGVLAYGVFELGKSLFAGELGWNSGGRWLAGAMLALAAAYQLTPLKAACLERCTSAPQVGPGASRSYALALGVREGGWCIGCSWALMAALFALGVMSLTWMALIAALLVLEKVGPWRRAGTLATAIVLAALAAGVLAAPHRVPGLVVPGPSAMHAMMR
jgi:predicted metal-binding membrane protein